MISFRIFDYLKIVYGDDIDAFLNTTFLPKKGTELTISYCKFQN